MSRTAPTSKLPSVPIPAAGIPHNVWALALGAPTARTMAWIVAVLVKVTLNWSAVEFFIGVSIELDNVAGRHLSFPP